MGLEVEGGSKLNRWSGGEGATWGDERLSGALVAGKEWHWEV